MKTAFRDLKLQQLDDTLAKWRSPDLAVRPQQGWSCAIREALGMSASALARRLGISQAGLRKLEQSEANGTITLASLNKLAESLDCELRYALVPRTSLSEHLHTRAQEVVRNRLGPVAHSMALEDQSVFQRDSDRQIEFAVKELLSQSRRALW